MSNSFDEITIADLQAFGIIGVYDWERKTPREIIVNLTFYTDISNVAKTDNLDDSLDYEVVANEVRQLVENASRKTIEALATDIAILCLGYPGVKKIKVSVEKPGIFKFARSVGVTIIRSRN